MERVKGIEPSFFKIKNGMGYAYSIAWPHCMNKNIHFPNAWLRQKCNLTRALAVTHSPRAGSQRKTSMNTTASSLPVLGRMLFTGMVVWNLAVNQTFARADGAHDATAPGAALGRDAAARDGSTSGLPAAASRSGAKGQSLAGPAREVERRSTSQGAWRDLVVDLNAGRVALCARFVLAMRPRRSPCPGPFFSPTDEKQARLVADSLNLAGAPHGSGKDLNALMQALPGTYEYFGQKISWNAGNVPTQARKCSDLMGVKVHTISGESLGVVVNLMVDLPASQVAFVVVSAAGTSADNMYAVPPSACQNSPDRTGLIVNIDKARIASLAQREGFSSSNLTETNGGLREHRTHAVVLVRNAGSGPVPPMPPQRRNVGPSAPRSPLPAPARIKSQSKATTSFPGIF